MIEIAIHTKYMKRALSLAELGRGKVAPNPMVGAVIVYKDKIIGEGYHHQAGAAHAEVNAIAAVQDKELLKDSTLYVTLEPCSHFGKTPPCSDLIIKYQIPRVVVAMQDPFPEVSGRGIARLRAHGIEVILGILEHEARELNRAFLVNQLEHRPYILLKWAQSIDGYLDRSRSNPLEPAFRFSSPFKQRENHKLRMEYDAILVGYNTYQLDRPMLNNRYWRGASPRKILFLSRAASTLEILEGWDAPQNMLITPKGSTSIAGKISVIEIDIKHKSDLEDLLFLLYEKGICSLIVEGGRQTLELFLSGGYYDAINIETKEVLLEGGVRAPRLDKPENR